MSPVTAERQGDLRVVTLRRHAKLNTVNAEALDALAACFGDEDGLRAVVLAGEGERAFIGGADITEMAALDGPEAARGFISRIHRVNAAIRACPVPVVARIQGWCLGAGMEIAAACDLRVASENARFGMPEVRVGIPSVIEAALLPGLIGWARTRRLLLLAEVLDAATLESWGFLDRVAPPAALDAALEEVLRLIREAGPRAIRDQKALMARWETMTVGEAIQAGIESFAAAFTTDEPRRMMDAFLERKRG